MRCSSLSSESNDPTNRSKDDNRGSPYAAGHLEAREAAVGGGELPAEGGATGDIGADRRRSRCGSLADRGESDPGREQVAEERDGAVEDAVRTAAARHARGAVPTGVGPGPDRGTGRYAGAQDGAERSRGSEIRTAGGRDGACPRAGGAADILGIGGRAPTVGGPRGSAGTAAGTVAEWRLCSNTREDDTNRRATSRPPRQRQKRRR